MSFMEYELEVNHGVVASVGKTSVTYFWRHIAGFKCSHTNRDRFSASLCRAGLRLEDANKLTKHLDKHDQCIPNHVTGGESND